MSDNRPPYHRRQTKPLPKVEIAPVSSSRLLSAEEGGTDESIDLEKANAITLVECPACKANGRECLLCEMNGMVTPEKRAGYLKENST